jgi:hypothetical protein
MKKTKYLLAMTFRKLGKSKQHDNSSKKGLNLYDKI